MDARFKDFDQFFAEQQRQPLRLRIFGEEHELPPSLPVSLVLTFRRMQQREASESVNDSELFDLFTAVFGTERLDSWVARGLDVEQLMALLGWAMEQYGVGGSKDDPKPERVQRGKASKK